MKKILIIDDEEDFCRFTKATLEMTGGYDVFTCSDSVDAISQVNLHCPDLILLDIVMPGMDGGEIAAELRTDEHTRDIPVIFLTALVAEDEMKGGIGIVKGHCYLAKTVKTDKLVYAIDKMIYQG